MSDKHVVDMTGWRVGRLTLLKRIGSKQKSSLWLARCDCGKYTQVTRSKIQSGHTKSCGCLKHDYTPANKRHGLTKTTTYNIWSSMRLRCYNKKAINYERYGARGIKVCERWRRSFDNFLADMGKRPEGLCLDRMDNEGDYCHENCRWVEPKVQNRNTRVNRNITYKGETYCLAEWGELLNMNPQTISNRLDKLRWTIEEALTISPKGHHHKIVRI